MQFRVSELRELISNYGPEGAINADLLTTVLHPIKREKIDSLMEKYTIAEISVMGASKFIGEGFTENEAVKLVSLFEVARRLETFIREPRRKISSPKDVYAIMYPKLREQKKEKFIVLILDTKNNIIKEELVAIGSLNASIVHPREVFKPAIEISAAAIILVHNHPSGDPSPSREDIMVTEKLVEGGKLLGIDILDHIIIGDGRYVSLKDEGFIK